MASSKPVLTYQTMFFGSDMTIKISSVEGNSQWLDGGAMFGNVPRALWEKWVEVDARSRIRLACRGLLIECDGLRILCETGIGAFFEPKLAERFGVAEKDHVLLASLAKLGLGDEDIDYVVLSHLHFDHAGGLLPTYAEIAAGRDRLLFPKAKYVVGAQAFARAEAPHPRDRASFIPGMTEKLRASGRLVLVEGERLPGVLDDRLSFFTSDGHTPGHMHTVFRGDQRTVCFAGDLVPGTAWVHLAVTMGYDRFAERVIDEKAALYAKAEPQKWLLFYTHDTACTASTVTHTQDGKYTAGEKHAQLMRLPI
jgi:glyoxylase-like metal-dependent hydrolase (beta-lactamase superfamily II)